MSTTDHDREDRLRAALARSAGTYAPPPAPVGRILTEGRVRRARRRAGYAAAVAAVVAAGVALPMVLRGPSPEAAGPASGATTAAGRRAEPTATGRPTTAPHQGAAPVTTQVRSGRTDGVDWSVSLVFYPQRPAGFTPGSKPSGMPTPPLKSSLICAHVVIGGVRVDHQGGPWSDCDMVDGTTDQAEQDFYEGPWGLHDKGLSGTRIFVSSTHDAAYGTVTLTDGTRVTGQSVTVPGTRYRAWAAPVPDGAAIAAVDQYDAGHHRISHETQWR